MNASNIRTKDIMNCLPLVASTLGDKYGVRVHIGGQRACTDGSEIYLPALPLDCDEELLLCARGFLDHEAAHIRHTDIELVKNSDVTPLEKHLLNTIEDWRVENALAVIFPGCRHNFTKLIQREFISAYAPESDIEATVHILNAILLTVRFWDVKAVGTRRNQCLAFVEHLFPGLWPTLTPVLEEIRQTCRTTQDSIDRAREIAKLLQEYGENQAEQNQNSEQHLEQNTEPGQDEEHEQTPAPDAEDNADGTADGEDDSPEHSEGASGSQDTPQDVGSSESDAADDATMDTTGDTPATTTPSSGLPETNDASARAELVQALLAADTADLPETMGEHLAAMLEESSGTTNSYNALCVAKTGWMHTFEFDSSATGEIRRASTALRVRLHSLMQAQTLQRSKPGYRGRLHTGLLHKIMLNDPQIFMRQGIKQRTDTAIHILLDRSGSMNPIIHIATAACYAVASALTGIPGISLGVTAFPADNTCENEREAYVAPILKHGERLHTRFNTFADGDTPLAEALWWTMQQMSPLSQPRKIILILTDGDPNGIAATAKAASTARQLGFELYGIGIRDWGILRFLPDSSRVITHIGELAPAMFDMMRKALTE